MATTAQILANRNNSQKSTGPKTLEGKAVVSQNAVKHGLFAAEAVITGENPADYELYHDNFLAELLPVGMIESMLAERIVSLAWRLQRAERMQNESIDVLIAKIETDPWQQTRRERAAGARDSRAGESKLLLGWATKDDFSETRVLDRMMLYERRIENSLHKTINRLKQYQVIRRVEKEDANRRQPARESSHPAGNLDDLKEQNQNRPSAGNPKHETRNPKRVEMAHLKKQSQFAVAHLAAKSCLHRGYDNNPAGVAEENKANPSGQSMPERHCRTDQSQSQPPLREQEKADIGNSAIYK